MHKFANSLGTLLLVVTFCAIALWASVLIPIVLGCAFVVFLLFLLVAWLVDVWHAVWRRIRSPPARR
jgi:hypothetical protein